MRLIAFLFALAALASACSFDRDQEDATRQQGARSTAADECGVSGSITDLSQEPGYSANYLHRWTTEDGCPVRLDVLMTRRGPDACGGANVADILMGWPLGKSHADHRAFRIFARDPANILHGPKISHAFDGDAELPADAIDTGFRQDEAELWMPPGDDAFVYLVYSDRTERWPHDPTPTGCA